MPLRDTSLALLLNDYGKPFASAAAFGNKFADWCNAAGLEVKCSAVTVARAVIARMVCVRPRARLLLMPDVLLRQPLRGHSTLAQVQVYIDEFEAEKMADAAMDKLTKQRTSSG